MRKIVVAITTAITFGVAGAMLVSNPALAAPKKSMRAMMAEMKAKDPQSFAACQDLARDRGYRGGEVQSSPSVMMFVEGCMMGKQH
jgi:hypothetical protein